MEYLTAEDIIRMNVTLIQSFSPKEQIGIKDANALQMAVSQPQQEVFGQALYPPIYDKATILLINLIKKHPFHNANKRTAWLAMDIFFKINGFNTSFPDEVGLEYILNITVSEKPFDDLKETTVHFLKESPYIIKQ